MKIWGLVFSVGAGNGHDYAASFLLYLNSKSNIGQEKKYIYRHIKILYL